MKEKELKKTQQENRNLQLTKETAQGYQWISQQKSYRA